MKIGLTGSIACGKSGVSSYLRSLHYPVIDADAISHQLTAPGGAALPALREAFGEALFSGGQLDRRALGQLVFSHPDQRERLNALLHPMILNEVARQLAEHDAPDALVFGDIPLLYECHMEPQFDLIWVVYAPRDVQITRLFIRDGLSKAEAVRRIDSQMPLSEKMRRADAVISTDGPVEETQRQVRALLRSAAQRRQL